MSWAEITRKWKSPSTIRTVVLLGNTVLLVIGLYHWWRPVFYALPVVAAILLTIVSAVALAPELQRKLGKPIRILLVVLLCIIGIAAAVANVLQQSEEEKRVKSKNIEHSNQLAELSNQLARVEQGVNRLVAEGKLTKEDAAKILSKASNLRQGDHVRLSISLREMRICLRLK